MIGLTGDNMSSLDRYEGGVSVFSLFVPPPSSLFWATSQLYQRENIDIHKVAELTPFADVDIKVLTAPIDCLPENLSEKVDAVTYVWAEDMSNLKKEAWSFDEFVATKLSRWM